MTRISGWCNGHDGCTSPRAHETCSERLTKGLLERCDCAAFDGHPNAQNGSTVGVAAPEEVR